MGCEHTKKYYLCQGTHSNYDGELELLPLKK